MVSGLLEGGGWFKAGVPVLSQVDSKVFFLGNVDAGVGGKSHVKPCFRPCIHDDDDNDDKMCEVRFIHWSADWPPPYC